MDTTNPAPIVNGELLRRYSGRRVRCVLKLQRPEASGGVIVGYTADNHQVSARLPTGAPPSEYIEVIGIVEGENSIRGEMCTNFGTNFDMSTHNQLCLLANGEHKDIFV